MPDPIAGAASLAARNIAFQEALAPRVSKGFLRNLSNGRTQTFLFNPSQFEESYEAEYARHSSPGLSHERLQFTGNKNGKIPLELIFDEYFLRLGLLPSSSVGGRSRRIAQDTGSSKGVSANTGVDAVKRFFLEVLYPRRSQRLITASPPPVLFVWPGQHSMRVRVTKVKFKHAQFAVPTAFTRILLVSVDLEEDVPERIYSEAVFGYGTRRPWASSDSPRRRGS